MKLPRYYVDPATELVHDFWLHDEDLLKQFKSQNLKAGQKIVLYNDVHHERLYNIEELKSEEVHLLMLTELMPSKKE